MLIVCNCPCVGVNIILTNVCCVLLQLVRGGEYGLGIIGIR
jgi:hypothetical protein